MELTLKNVSKQYGTKQVLKNINYTFNYGLTGLLGPNGAGKSTLMRLMTTVETPTTGEIIWNGQKVSDQPRNLRSVLGYLPQDFGIYPNMNPVEFLEYMAAMKSLSMASAKKRINALLEVLHLVDVRKRTLGSFSGGMKQRVGIAQALLNDPSVLIVDEPTVGLDPEERIAFRNLLSTLGENRIIILSTHIVTDIESIAPKIVMLNGGVMLPESTPEALISSAEGKIWEVITTADKISALQQNYRISGSIQRNDGTHLRVISDKKPTLDAAPMLPSLEDAYLYAIKERR